MSTEHCDGPLVEDNSLLCKAGKLRSHDLPIIISVSFSICQTSPDSPHHCRLMTTAHTHITSRRTSSLLGLQKAQNSQAMDSRLQTHEYVCFPVTF
ncbi:hypothetical protein PO909_019986 [Leuciscus waleckii]